MKCTPNGWVMQCPSRAAYAVRDLPGGALIEIVCEGVPWKWNAMNHDIILKRFEQPDELRV